MTYHDDERIPETQSHGDLDPPRRPPPTAVGAGTPEEPDRRPAELFDRARVRATATARRPLPARALGSLIRGVRRVVKRKLRSVRR